MAKQSKQIKAARGNKIMRYALPIEIPAHKELIDCICFGSCKKIAIACIDVNGAGICWICEKTNCKYEAQSIQIASDITLRRISGGCRKNRKGNGVFTGG